MGTLTLGTSVIRQLDGLYSLNDFHRASGGEEKHAPNRFLRLDTTQALITEIDQTPEMALALKIAHGGKKPGTYACRELVIAYAAWISAAFHLKVIRVFLGHLEGTQKSLSLAGEVVLDPYEAFNLYGLLKMVEVHLSKERILPIERALRAVFSPLESQVYDLHAEVRVRALLLSPLRERCETVYRQLGGGR